MWSRILLEKSKENQYLVSLSLPWKVWAHSFIPAGLLPHLGELDSRLNPAR